MVGQRKRALQLSLFLVVFFVAWSFRATRFYAVDESIVSPTGRALYSQLLKFILWVLPAAAFVFSFRNEPVARYLGWSVFPGARIWLRCCAATGLYLLMVAVFELVIGRKTFSPTTWSAQPLLITFLQFGVSPLLEETLFRGLVMKELMTLLPTCLAGTLSSLLFLGAHLPYWFSHGGFTPALLANSLGVLIFSAVACWLFAESRSIWPPTVAHIANNVLSSLLVVPAV